VPGPGEVIVKLEAAGMNYADIYRRQGLFSQRGPAPWVPGWEGAGTIVDLGPDGAAAGFGIGDKVAWCDNPKSNAELVAVAIDKLIRVPSSISAQQAASVLLQGLTAHFLVHDSHP
jgi:NADPH2:quinone reductase